MRCALDLRVVAFTIMIGRSVLLGWLVGIAALSGIVVAQERPVITEATLEDGYLKVVAEAPPGFSYAVLEGGEDVARPLSTALISGEMKDSGGILTFTLPEPAAIGFLRLRLGRFGSPPVGQHSDPGRFNFSADVTVPGGGSGGGTIEPGPIAQFGLEEQATHVLSRVAYGPTRPDRDWILADGVGAYLNAQLRPGTIDEEANTGLRVRENRLFQTFEPYEQRFLIREGDEWAYFKGTEAPPGAWASLAFDDSGWERGPSGFGYGDGDDATRLYDMRYLEGEQEGYLTVYIRREFEVDDPASLKAFALQVDYDDGFIAFINGREVARANVSGSRVPHDQDAAGGHEAGSAETFWLDPATISLNAGRNVLAIQGHNYKIDSSDFTLIPELLEAPVMEGEPSIRRPLGIDELQHLLHVRGIYAKRQLQAVLGEFWENHFTTDYDKVVEYLEDMEDENGYGLSEEQAEAEAVHVEYEEYEFFHRNALGNFGDLLLYSATSPAQLIYLDNVLNVKGEPNENYSREILELFAFGVDNRYEQKDIEELARCFTGWTIAKVRPSAFQAFPDSALNPVLGPSEVLNIREGWKYVPGLREPSGNRTGRATTIWAEADFDDRAWLTGDAGFGYGDDDDVTLLDDMRGEYVSVYLRKKFVLPPQFDADSARFNFRYDDGVVVYLNGVEIGRSPSMEGLDSPPRFNNPARRDHEVTAEPLEIGLASFSNLLNPAPEENILAVQVHNKSLSSTDLSFIPSLLQTGASARGMLPIDHPSGRWTFKFDPSLHDDEEKVLFEGTDYETIVPAGRRGPEGLRDAADVVRAMVDHPSTAEFITIKLVNKFVSDEISLESYHEQTAPLALLALVDEMMVAWNSTAPAGNIETVMRVLLDPEHLASAFWEESADRTKIKTALEFVNSCARVLEADVLEPGLGDVVEDLGMSFFRRDDPDGWSEIGLDWMDTSMLLERVKFAQTLGENRSASVARWDTRRFLSVHGFDNPIDIINYFDQLMFGGSLTQAQKNVLTQFFNMNNAGERSVPQPRTSLFTNRTEELVTLLLSAPQWHFQ